MSNPVAGTHHTVIKDDWLSTISRDAYGDINKWPLIADANPHINGRGVAVDGSPLIFPNDVLWIPADEAPEEDAPISFAQQQEDSFSLTIDGEAVAVISGSLLVTMDTGSDEVTAEIDIMSITPKIRKALLPYKYPKCQVRINGELKLTGAIYMVSPSSDGTKKTKKIVGYSSTADVIDSVMNPPYEQTGVTFAKHAQTLLNDFGLKAVFYSGADEYFDKITMKDGQKRFSHLANLAKERGLLVSCTPYGNLLFLKANTNKRAVDTLEEGQGGPLGFSAKYDGRKRFSSYRIVGKSIVGGAETRTVADPYVSRSRYFSKKESRLADRSDKSATWERSKAIADALSISITVDSWKTKKGELWRDNTYVKVISPTLDLRKGVSLLIRRVRFNFSSAALNSVLDLIPAEAYTGKQIPELWS